jgi:DNA polymerase-3 subunit delta
VANASSTRRNAPAERLVASPELRPAYLIHGDDHAAIAERRAGLRALAEGHGSAASVEVLEGDAAAPAAVARALAAMTLALARRVIIVEGVERWRRADTERDLLPALASMPPETTLALFAREEQRAKAPEGLAKAVERAGGQVVAHSTVKPWELARWVRGQAARVGLFLDGPAAQALVAQVGGRQQRLLRELERLALEADVSGDGRRPPAALDADEVHRRATHSAQWRAYALADAILASDERDAVACYVRLREQGESLSGLIYAMTRRLREALELARRIKQGRPTSDVTRGMPAGAATRLLADVSRADPERLRRALVALAELELDTRGGAPLSWARSPAAAMDEDAVALLALARMTR